MENAPLNNSSPNNVTSSHGFTPAWLLPSLVIMVVASAGAYGWLYQQHQLQIAMWQQAQVQWQQHQQTQTERWQNEIQDLSQRVQQQQQEVENTRTIVLGGAQQFSDAQRRHAAEYFIQEADKALLLAQDVVRARQLLEAAEQELAGSHNSRDAELRKAVQNDVNTLQSVAVIDVLTIAKDLAQKQQQIIHLHPLAPLQSASVSEPIFNVDSDNVWQRFVQNVQKFSGDWFVVRHHDSVLAAPLTALESRQVKQTISLHLVTAQIAALRHQPIIYREALNAALQLLQQHYADDQQGSELINALQQLAIRSVDLGVELTLQSVERLRANPAAENQP